MAVHHFTLADDDADFLFLIHRKLSREYPESQIATFTAAEEALVHILNVGADALITDHGMGKMSGTQLIRELRDRGFQIPIFMLSGSPHVVDEALAVGASKFFHKHGDFESVWAELRPAIKSTVN